MPTGNMFTTKQAPAAMQQIAPDLAAEQVQLSRQQQMADLLRQQSLTPSGNTEMVSGWAVKKSPLEGLAKMAQALAANYGQQQGDAKQAALSKALQQSQSDAFDRMAGGQPAATQPDQLGEPGSMPEAPAAPQMTQEQRIRAQAKAAYLMGNKELANKLLENISTLTTEQRNMAAMGQNPLQMGALDTAAKKKNGIIELQPGTTALDLATGQERFQPKVGEGISLNNGQASELPGYASANAGIVGAAAQATAGAQAAQDMVTVNTPQGPRMMTRAQAVQLSGGQPAQVPTAPPPGLNNMTPQQSQTLMKQAQAQFGLQPGGTPGTSVQGPGIPLQTEAQKAAEVGTVQNNLAVDKERRSAAQSPEAQQKLLDAQDVIGLSKMANDILSKGKATGSLAGQVRDKVAGAVGVSTVSSQDAAQLAAIGGMMTSKMPKMSGPQSDKDVLTYKEMAGKVGDPSVPIGDRIAALVVIDKLNQKYLKTNENSVANEALGANTRNGPVRRYNVATGKIE